MFRSLIPVLCALAVWPSISNAVENDAAYRLSPGDNLSVSVWGEDKLKQDVTRTSRWQHYLPAGRAGRCFGA